DFTGRDEVGVLAREIDRMMARVAESRRQLVDQSFQAGFAELAKGVLHNLGNAMTPIEVRLSKVRARLKAAPVEDVERAVAELRTETVDTARRADLEEFLRLAGEQLAMTVRALEEDVSVISRQTGIVHSALSEQMRSTRNEHVIEAVRLPDLLAQSLEVVPDCARQRLVIESDRSLSDVGVVNIPRTVLRLVLQNFIINAADAVGELGKSRGTFRVAAELRCAEGQEQLYLHCSDDGVGIASGNLERVFEKGFSSKSKETNFGIGLHWCANAVGALRGRVWATSDGAGRGATLHVCVPLASRAGVSIIKAA
ncbi:MAG TPA: HAMP domain-containing sensor histidine kinase, partial [Steroidobacteraceae bacterium]|nr:HAMP domain-containing sensor histidine kinase [Steroidobacteraceae bacterium]